MATAVRSEPMEENDLGYVRDKVQRILRAWDSRTPNQLLADNIVLSISLGAKGTSLVGCLPFGDKVRVTGREQAKRVLSGIYSNIRKGFSITTEVVSGYDVLLLGNLAIPPTGDDRLSMPLIIYMGFDDEGKVKKMTIAGANPKPITKAIRGELRKQLRVSGSFRS